MENAFKVSVGHLPRVLGRWGRNYSTGHKVIIIAHSIIIPWPVINSFRRPQKEKNKKTIVWITLVFSSLSMWSSLFLPSERSMRSEEEERDHRTGLLSSDGPRHLLFLLPMVFSVVGRKEKCAGVREVDW